MYVGPADPADVVLDMVAGEYVARELSCLAEDGRIVLIAVQGGTKSQVDAGLVLRKRLTLTGSTLRARPVAFKSAMRSAVAFMSENTRSAHFAPLATTTPPAPDPHPRSSARPNTRTFGR